MKRVALLLMAALALPAFAHDAAPTPATPTNPALAATPAPANPPGVAAPAAPPAKLPTALAQQLRQLQDAALASTWGLDLLRELTDGIGPRLSGSANLEVAVKHVEARARALGLDTRVEPVLVPHWQRGVERAELLDWPGRLTDTPHPLSLLTLGNSAATPPEGLVADVLPVADLEALDALDPKTVAGRIVVFTAAFDETMAAQGQGGDAYGRVSAIRSRGPARVAKLGAAACLVRSAGSGAYRLPHTGNTVFEPGQAAIPAAALSAEDAALIARLGKGRMRLVLTPQTLPDAMSGNVIAELRGSAQPEEIVLVSGHLDSWDVGTGALDDGAGVAVALDALRLIKAAGLKPRRTLRFVAYTNEENGTRGAAAYAKEHAAELPRHVAGIESDSGAGHPTGIHAKVTTPGALQLKPLADAMARFGAGVVDQIVRCPGVDIGPLCDAGVPGFAPRQDSRSYFTYHHTQADTFDKVVPRELAENTAVMASLLWGLSELPALPRLPPPAP